MPRRFAVTDGTVSLELPDKTEVPSPGGVRAIRESLTSLTAYHSYALAAYTRSAGPAW